MKYEYQPPIGRRWLWTAIVGLTPFFSLLAKPLTFEVQTRDPRSGEVIRRQETVDSSNVAVVIVDPWNYHWCMTACERVSAMVPRWNRALECARKLGFPIIWCPSDVVGSYGGWPQRERALALTPLEVPKKGALACAFTASVGRCMCGPGLNCIVNYGEYAINPDLVIADADYIASSTPEVYTILRRHDITHVIYLGLHTNMCLFGKPGALRDMADAGLVCWLARDINDAFTHYDPAAGFTPDRGTQQTDEDLERAGIPTLNLVEAWRKAGLWNDDWIVETVRITPWGKPGRPYLFEQGVDVTLTAPWLENVEIHYTLEQCEDVGRPPTLTTNGPTAQSPRYNKPLHVTETSMLRTLAFRDGRPVSLPTSAWFVRLPHPVPKPDVFLDDLPPILDPYANGGGHIFFWVPKVGQSFEGKELRIRASKYAKGLGFRAPSSVRYAVKPEYARFVARVGIADDLVAEAYGANMAAHGSVIFRVFVDERLAAESPVMRVSQEPWRFDVPLPSGSRHITLACLDTASWSLLDLGNWVDAGFVLKEGAPAKTAARAADNANALDPAYKHASQEAYERWRDLKYGIRIHWGVYSKLGVEASWPILKMTNGERASYQELYKTFNPTEFDADQWMRWFERCGMKMFAFTTRHCDGFSMYDTKTRVKRRVNYGAPGGPKPEDCDLAYSIMETPFKRDIVKELCDAAHKHNIAIDLYFSHWDWYDYDFRSCENFPFVAPGDKMTSAQDDPEGYARMIQRHRDSILELLSNYGKIDMMCLDVGLPEFCWPGVKETIMKARQLQPDVLFRNRGIGAYGDYHTPENWIPDSPQSRESPLPWMVIYTMAPIFAYEADGTKYRPAEWVLSSLIDIVAKGGNFQISIGPDDKGHFHPTAVQRLEQVGDWLKVNGEAIYATRPWTYWKEGESVRFTRSKDAKFVYAISLAWPGETLRLRSLAPRPGTKVQMLGVSEPLEWSMGELDDLVVKLPARLQEPANRPCQQAYVFKFEAEPRETTPIPKAAFISGGWLGNEATVSLTSGAATAEIHYTTDGSPPTKQSRIYDSPIMLRRSQTLRARAIQPGAAASDELQVALGVMRINFQPASTPVPEGYVADTGEAFGSRGNGAVYGWSSDNTAQTRQRGQGGVQDTFCHFLAQQQWELAVPPGHYAVRVVVGDASFASQSTINVEGVNLCRDLSLSSGTKALTGEAEVKDGRLTVDCGDSPERMTKIAAIEITAK